LHFILGTFANLRKVTISLIKSVPPPVRHSVRMEQLGSHWTDIREMLHLGIFRKSIERKFH